MPTTKLGVSGYFCGLRAVVPLYHLCQEKILDTYRNMLYTMSSQNTLRGMDYGFGCIQIEYAAGFLRPASDGESVHLSGFALQSGSQHGRNCSEIRYQQTGSI